MIMSLKQRKIKYEPWIKLNHNIYILNVLHKVNLTPAILLKFLGGKREVGKAKSTASETQE